MTDRYNSIERLRARVDYNPSDFFENNEVKRFDRLLGGEPFVGDDPDGWAGLEGEARAMINTLTGDETFNEELGRVDEIRATDDASIPLVYPIRDVSKVEAKTHIGGDYFDLDADQFDFSDHRLILADRTNRVGTGVGRRAANELIRHNQRTTWGDLYAKLRVTYDRGYDPIPANIKAIQVAIVNRQLRMLRGEQAIAAASPDEFAGVSPQFDMVLTDDIRRRIEDLTPLAGATQSV
ncbi:hypothetical protein OSG_eHP28_00140 [environmental Halophage eHP-28]|nr:hypothetical protein OSG_eHP28_00140 [environmental Halophage eHP-28]